MQSRTTQHRTVLISALALLLFAVGRALWAESPEALVQQGNEAFAQGNYEEAVKAYDQASVDIPESPHLYFNRGTVHYRQEELKKATEAFRKAALKSRDLVLEAKCKYNLGNCAFRECERQRDSNLKKALEQCEKAINYYREALDLDPDLEDAGRNIEVARLTMKMILDEINKRKEEAEKKQNQQEETAKELQQLIKRQENAIVRNRDLSSQAGTAGRMSPNVKRGVGELRGDQDTLRNDTEEFSDNLDRTIRQGAQSQPQPATPLDAAKEHVDQAVSSQGKAVDQLTREDLPNAELEQAEALESLKKALDEMTGKQDRQGAGDKSNAPDGQQQKEKGGQQKQQQKEDGQQQNSAEDKQKKAEEKRRREAMARQNAQDILDEEAENQEKRRVKSRSGSYRAVERDW